MGLARPETQTTVAERDALKRFAAGREHLVEIGVWHGVTTSILRSAMASSGVLFAVDPFSSGRLGVSFQKLVAHSNVEKIPNGRVKWVETTGEAAARAFQSELGRNVEFIFIDGDHSYEGIRTDWNAWRDLVKVGGIVALHDSQPLGSHVTENSGSVRFSRETIFPDKRFQTVDITDSLTVLKRVA